LAEVRVGIAVESLAAWIAHAKGAHVPTTERLTESEREELRRLRRENARLREEREILNKAAAFFAQDRRDDR
jgi:transposase